MNRDEFAPGGAAPVLSVVVPLFDEQAAVPALAARLARVLDRLGVEAEVILVDDGSRDATLAAIKRAHARDPRFVGLVLSRNFGHQLAISAGLDHARGRAVVVMDGDLQDPPEAIEALWAKFGEGYDVVYATRASRPEPWWKRAAYRAYYRLLRRVVAIELPLDAGDFGIMSRRVVDLINAMPERRRFVRGLRAWVGLRQTGLAIDRAPRHSGRPKFTLVKLAALALDGLIGFAGSPFHWVGGFGLVSLAAALVGSFAGLVRGAVGGGWLPGWCWVGLTVAFYAGVLLFSLALAGEYVGRVFDEVNGRPLYVVRGRIGFRGPRRTRHATVRLTPHHRPGKVSPEWRVDNRRDGGVQGR
jgi:dolichol-phosphate mannosyltransferase